MTDTAHAAGAYDPGPPATEQLAWGSEPDVSGGPEPVDDDPPSAALPCAAEAEAVRREYGDDAAHAYSVMAAEDRAATEQLRREWAGDFGENLKFAKAAAAELMTDDLRSYLERTGLGDHPSMIALAAKLGRQMAHGGNVGGTPMTDAMPAPGGGADLERQIDQLTAQIHDAQDNNDFDAAHRLSAQRSALSARLVGTGPIVGAGGRRW